jgi:hypothetical protein
LATYTPVDIAQALANLTNQVTAGFAQINQRLDRLDGIDQRLDGIGQHLNVVEAISRNTRILSRNLQSPTLQHFVLLQKTVSSQFSILIIF